MAEALAALAVRLPAATAIAAQSEPISKYLGIYISNTS
jgi:hypothetical protein